MYRSRLDPWLYGAHLPQHLGLLALGSRHYYPTTCFILLGQQCSGRHCVIAIFPTTTPQHPYKHALTIPWYLSASGKGNCCVFRCVCHILTLHFNIFGIVAFKLKLYSTNGTTKSQNLQPLTNVLLHWDINATNKIQQFSNNVHQHTHFFSKYIPKIPIF